MVSNTETEEKLLQKLLHTSSKYTSRSQKTILRKAFHLATDAHKFQKRLSGEPYIIHPLNVAIILAEIELDFEALAAALLHDILEDTNISKEYLIEEFGVTITDLVDGVTKISKLKSQSAISQQAGNIRKLILATIKEPRVIIIKLADKLHNMRTLKFHRQEKIIRISNEVLDIYAPMAGRLGIYKIKSELEDLAFYYTAPTHYQEIKEYISEKREERNENLKIIKGVLSSKLKENKVKAVIEARSKHFYSIAQKINKSGKSIEEIYDLSGFRILVRNQQDCYATIGIVHALYNPIPGRFKDYIAVSKSNGYKSLHTTVIGERGRPFEIQIRTHSMHVEAEFGIAAHWAYKEKVPVESSTQLGHIQNIALMHDTSSEEASFFIEELKFNLTETEVYVFTPKGDIISMPKGSTILDFAFRIHTDLGLKCQGAKIGNRHVSIRTKISSGDQIFIITSPNVRPSINWLKCLQTAGARSKLRQWLRKQDAEFLLEPIQEKKETKSSATNKKKQSIKKQTPVVTWAGQTNLESRFAKCCSPLPGDLISGFITRGQGISVHKSSCPSLLTLKRNEETTERVIPLEWTGIFEAFTITIQVVGNDRPHLYLEMVECLTHSGANIIEAKATTKQDGKIHNYFTIEVDSKKHLQTITNEIKKINGVEKAHQVAKSKN